MGIIKHYNLETNQWEIDGSGDASNILLAEPRLLDTEDKTISVLRGFTKVMNKINKLELNVAWIYQHGAKGGSGGGSGGGGGLGGTITAYASITGAPLTNNIYYTTTSTVTLYLQITSALQKRFTLEISNANNSKPFTTSPTNITSGPITAVTLQGITSNTTNLTITAYDALGNYTNYLFNISVKLTTLNFSESTAPTNYILDGSDINGTFNIRNETGNEAILAVWNSNVSDPQAEEIKPIYTTEIRNPFDGTRSVNFTLLMKLIKPNLLLGDSFVFKLRVYSEVIEGLKTNYLTYSLSVVGGDGILIVIDHSKISTDYELPTEVLYTLPLGFNINFYYPTTSILTGQYKYSIYGVKAGEEDKEIRSTDYILVRLNTNIYFSISTTNQFMPEEYDYYRIELTAKTSEQDVSNKTVYFKIVGSADDTLITTYDNRRLICKFDTDNSPDSSATTWTWDLKSTGAYSHEDLNSLPIKNSTSLKVYKNSEPFISTETCASKFINLSGASYATYEDFAKLLDNRIPVSRLMNEGFYLLLTYELIDDSTGVIMSFGDYVGDTLTNGIEITSEEVKLVYNPTPSILISPQVIVDLPTVMTYSNAVEQKKNKVTVVGINVWKALLNLASGNSEVYYFAVYLNGVMSGISTVNASIARLAWSFANNILYFGINKNLNNPCDVKIYDFKLYDTSLNDYGIVVNYINSVELANLDAIGNRDTDLDIDLRKKNLFSLYSNQCLLYLDGNRVDDATLLRLLKSIYTDGSTEYELDYPIIEIVDQGPTGNYDELEYYLSATWAESQAPNLLNTKFYCDINIYSKEGNLEISNKTPLNRATVSIQGTSSVTYISKNLEITTGIDDETNKDRYLIINNWLPEKEFTLKSDVVDSGHVNNVAIGLMINNSSVFSQKPPMSNDNAIARKVKHTSEGFPCLVFVTFRATATSDQKTVLQGIYNFNLGRFAYNNLGLRKLESFTANNITYTDAVGTIDIPKPSLVTELTWSTKYDTGTYSIEVDEHALNVFEGFTYKEADPEHNHLIADLITTVRYPEANLEDAKKAITVDIFNHLADLSVRLPGETVEDYPIGEYILNLDEWEPHKRDDGTWYDSRTGLNWTDFLPNLQYTSSLLATDEVNSWLDLDTARKYYVLAMIFGMVDSMCKNMVFRKWNDDPKWYLCFYDMDSCLQADNKGNAVVEYYAHPHKYSNISSEGITQSGDGVNTGVIYNYPYDNSERRYFGVEYNRLWNVLYAMDIQNSGNALTSEDTMIIPKVYWTIRELFVKTFSDFMINYYDNHINKTGAILYNIDYRIKYVSYDKTWKDGVLIDQETNKLTGFLHGTRSASVAKWFKKRLKFLDSAYLDYYMGTKPLEDSIYSLVWTATQSATRQNILVLINTPSKIKLRYSTTGNNALSATFWAEEDSPLQTIRAATNQATWTIEGTGYIKDFVNFKGLQWYSFGQEFNFTLLEELDLSDLAMNEFTSAGMSKPFQYMPNLKRLILSNFKLSNPSANRNIDLEPNTKIEYVDISNSVFNSLTLPTSGTLRYLNVSNSGVTSFGNFLDGQNSLETLLFDGCSILELNLVLLLALRTISTIPKTVESIQIDTCAITHLNIPFIKQSSNDTSKLRTVILRNCENLESLDLSNQDALNEITIENCPNLRTINFLDIRFEASAKGIDINFTAFTKLESLNLRNTSIVSELDLSNSPNLSNLNLELCGSITTLKCAYNNDNPIELQSGALRGCSQLSTIEGLYLIQGNEVFSGLSNLDFDSAFDSGNFNIIFSHSTYAGTNDLSNLFKGCTKLGTSRTNNYIVTILRKLPRTVTNISGMFEGTTSHIEISASTNLFNWGEDYPKGLASIERVFKDTLIYGILPSPSDKYKGLFLGLRITNAEAAFENTLVSRIDNNFFNFEDAKYLTLVDYMFRGCTQLEAVEDVYDTDIKKSPLSSKDFFIHLTGKHHEEFISTEGRDTYNDDWIYPYGIFAGTNIKMNVDLDENNRPYLFHVAKDTSTSPMNLSSNLYLGIHLILNAKDCDFSYLFGGNGDRILSDGSAVPRFRQISSPFTYSEDLELDLTKIGDAFWTEDTINMIMPFSGMNCIDGSTIPEDMFKNAINVQSLQGFFTGVNLDNMNGEVYEFTPKLFENCKKLTNISGMFLGCNKFRMRLCSDMFKNCSLVNVSSAFANSRVIERIPEGLFRQSDEAPTKNSISNMSGIFSGCWNLGHSADFTLKEIVDIKGLVYDSWTCHVIEGHEIGKRDHYAISNYTIPHDLFWYCKSNPSIERVLGDLFWLYNTTSEEQAFTQTDATKDENYFGPTGTIPEDIFHGEALMKSTTLKEVFAGTRFAPIREDSELAFPEYLNAIRRDDVYPTKLFYGMTNLEDISGMFRDSVILSHCTIPKDLFKCSDDAYMPLKNISYCWANVRFASTLSGADNAKYHALYDPRMFDTLPDINNISGIFMGGSYSSNVITGVNYVDEKLFAKCIDKRRQLNIASALANVPLIWNTSLTAPTFEFADVNDTTSFTTGAGSFLSGVEKTKFTNYEDLMNLGLAPAEWYNELQS